MSSWSAVLAQGKQPVGRICSPLKALGMFLWVSIAHRAMELPNVLHFTQASGDLLTLAWLSEGFSGTQAGGGKIWQAFGLQLCLGTARGSRGSILEAHNHVLSRTGLSP